MCVCTHGRVIDGDGNVLGWYGCITGRHVAPFLQGGPVHHHIDPPTRTGTHELTHLQQLSMQLFDPDWALPSLFLSPLATTTQSPSFCIFPLQYPGPQKFPHLQRKKPKNRKQQEKKETERKRYKKGENGMSGNETVPRYLWKKKTYVLKASFALEPVCTSASIFASTAVNAATRTHRNTKTFRRNILDQIKDTTKL